MDAGTIPSMKRTLFTAATLLLAPLALAQTPVSFPRYPALSPDGKTLVFSYQGDLWSTPTAGGAPARRLTSHVAYEGRALFSPDGKELAFQSNRFGRVEVFTMPAEGGPARRLTNYASGNSLQGWADGGKRVLIGSFRERTRRGQSFYTVANSDQPGRPKSVLALNNLFGGQLSPDGTKLVFVRGSSDWPRVGYRGSANAELWVYELATKQFKQLTDFDGQDLWPLWLPDSKSVVFVSERDGTYNLWKLSASGGKATQLTKYTGDGVRFPSISADGSRVAYEVENRIDTLSLTANATPQTVPLTVAADDKANPVETLNLTGPVSELAVSPDGEQVAVVLRGDVFVIAKEGGKATRVTEAPEREGSVVWAPDGKSLIFVKGHDFYAVASADPDEPKLTRALKRTTTRLTETPEAKVGAKFSPDGKLVAYQQGSGTLLIADSDFKNPRFVAKTLGLNAFSWAPDSKWLTYSADDEEFNAEVFVVPVSGGTPINVSRNPRNDTNPTFSPDGSKLFWASERPDRQSDIVWVYLRKDDEERSVEAWQKLKEKKKGATSASVSVAVDADGIHERVHALTATPGSETLFAVAGSEGMTQVAVVSGTDTLLFTVTDGAPAAPGRRIAAAGAGLLWNKSGQTLYLLGADGTLQTTTAASMGEGRPLAVRAKLTYDKRELQKAVFEEAWEVLNTIFYDPKFHGADWKALHDKYAPWAAAASDPLDFVDVVKIMMGHLNASHIGYIPPLAGATTLPTGLLGTSWDESYSGPGLKIAQVIKGSPADRTESRLLPGEIVTAINGTVLTEATDPDTLLADTVGERVPVSVTGVDGKTRELIVVPVSTTQLNTLLYDEWVASRQKLTHELSEGKLAYLHIQAMNKPSQDKFEMGLYAEGYGRDALLIDVRDNGGGNTADYLLTMLSLPRHAFTIGRDGAPGYPQDRLPLYPWRKPAALLINEFAYSNAEIFAHAFRTLDRGPIIGTPTFGAVISTSAATLLDGSTIRTPLRGWYRVSDGVNQEHSGAEPDIRLDLSPADELAGRDPQLEAAVKALLAKAKPTKLPAAKPAKLSTGK